MDPFVENVAAKYAGKVKVFKVNVMSEQPLALKFGVQGTPTFVMMCKGNLIASLVGEIHPSLLEWMASDTLLHNEGCVAKQTKVIYTITGY
jgi:thioredoxin-like negative regulator of GroEL